MRGTNKGKKEYLDLLYCIICCRYFVLVMNNLTDLILNRAPYVGIDSVYCHTKITNDQMSMDRTSLLFHRKTPTKRSFSTVPY